MDLCLRSYLLTVTSLISRGGIVLNAAAEKSPLQRRPHLSCVIHQTVRDILQAVRLTVLPAFFLLPPVLLLLLLPLLLRLVVTMMTTSLSLTTVAFAAQLAPIAPTDASTATIVALMILTIRNNVTHIVTASFLIPSSSHHYLENERQLYSRRHVCQETFCHAGSSISPPSASTLKVVTSR